MVQPCAAGFHCCYCCRNSDTKHMIEERATISLVPHVTLPRGTKAVTTFSRSGFQDHLHAQKTNTRQQTTTQIIRLSTALFHPVHKITTTRIVLQHLPMGHFGVTVCSYLKFSKLKIYSISSNNSRPSNNSPSPFCLSLIPSLSSKNLHLG